MVYIYSFIHSLIHRHLLSTCYKVAFTVLTTDNIKIEESITIVKDLSPDKLNVI